VDRKARAQLLVLLLAVGVAAVAGVIWYRNRPITLQGQMQRLPVRASILLYVDFAALRSAGLLQMLNASGATEDVDYQRFVLDTGFDYQQDLDTALVAFAPTGNYMLVRGSFEWKKLSAYADHHGGSCKDNLCDMPGSKPERNISYVPLRSGLMALAVSPRRGDAVNLEDPRPGPAPEFPGAPIWLGVPGSMLRSGTELPAGTRMFARAMERADYSTISLIPENHRFAAKLAVRCLTADDATQIAAELNRITGMLREMIAREKQTANPADLSGVLTSGSFRADGTRVDGYWPIERSFLDNILNGAMN
jgi:hypothetical protein